jgi:heme/copper-type cytochrome/quinol oxidase subunit 2
MMDSIMDAEITVTAVGNQWYWTYEWPLDSIESFMVDELMLAYGHGQ